jgi:exopolysaccharide biosynthesis WecB/TagA/CpsF family protein
MLSNVLEVEPASVAAGSDEICWPPKYDLLGVHVSATNYDEAIDVILRAARLRRPAVVSFQAVHAIVTASLDRTLRGMVNQFDLIGPDGQPVRWAMNWLHGTKLTERVYGPELTHRLCMRAAELGVPVYFYGGSPKVVRELEARLTAELPELRVVGAESPPYRPLTDAEDAAVVERINRSGAGLVFIGLGAPKQDVFGFEHRHSIDAVQVCVGAAFDFLAGHKKMAPAWMQRSGLEWLFRLTQEPGRLWRRYLVTNIVFATKLAVALFHEKLVRPQHGGAFRLALDTA